MTRRNEKAVLLNYPRFYHIEVEVYLTVYIITSEGTLNVVGIGHAPAEDCRWDHNSGSAILLFLKYNVMVNLQAEVFRRFTEFTAENSLEKFYGGNHNQRANSSENRKE